MDAKRLLSEALKLPAAAREALVDALMASLDQEPRKIDVEWVNEDVNTRGVDSGNGRVIDLNDARRKLLAKVEPGIK